MFLKKFLRFHRPKRTLYSKKYGVAQIQYTHATNTVIHTSTKIDGKLKACCLNHLSFIQMQHQMSPCNMYPLGPVQTSKFARAEPNTLNKYMKSSASESIRKACFNLERLSRSPPPSRPGILNLDRL